MIGVEKEPNTLLDGMRTIMHNSFVTRYSILKTDEFGEWLEELPPKTRSIVLGRLDMVSAGYFGDHKRFEGLLELRWLNGTRVYAFFWGASVVVALNGGNKNGQSRDIKKAKRIRDEVLDGTRTVQQP
jgi:putative addiction module killer protein